MARGTGSWGKEVGGGGGGGREGLDGEVVGEGGGG